MPTSRSSDGLAYICQHYGVPARIGGRVSYEGRPGTIIGTTGHYLRVQLDDEAVPSVHHATWHLTYEEASDAAA